MRLEHHLVGGYVRYIIIIITHAFMLYVHGELGCQESFLI